VRGDTFDPPELSHTLRDTLYNINVCMMVQAHDVQLYVMLHYKSKFHKGLQPRSLILSSERAYLCQEDYTRWPTVGGNNVQFEPQFTRDMRDVTRLQTFGIENEVVILFEDEQETAAAKENKNKPREWTLVPANPQEQQRIVKMFSFLWKNWFRIDLPIETRS